MRLTAEAVVSQWRYLLVSIFVVVFTVLNTLTGFGQRIPHVLHEYWSHQTVDPKILVGKIMLPTTDKIPTSKFDKYLTGRTTTPDNADAETVVICYWCVEAMFICGTWSHTYTLWDAVIRIISPNHRLLTVGEDSLTKSPLAIRAGAACVWYRWHTC